MLSPGYNYQKPKSNNASPQQAYSSSIMQTGQDYDSIMEGYKGVLNNPNDPELQGLMGNYKALLGQAQGQGKYTQSPHVAASLQGLGGLAQSGGYSPGDIGELRARASSPIRAVYANMMRDMERQKSIGGGYSPNFNAASSRMARESSEQMAGSANDMNARLAEMIASGKMQMAPQYASAALGESTLKHGTENANRGNQLNILGSMGDLYNTGNKNKLAALQGMNSLYGTTPALANTFGTQVLNFENQNLQNKGQNQAANIALMNGYRGNPQMSSGPSNSAFTMGNRPGDLIKRLSSKYGLQAGKPRLG